MDREIKKYSVSHSDFAFSFDIEIDLNKPSFYEDHDFYKKNGTHVDSTVKNDIKEMSLFWSGSPGSSASFEEHLEFFLRVLSRRIVSYLSEESSVEHYVNKEIGEQEGYYPVFGKDQAIYITNIEFDHDYLFDGISIKDENNGTRN